MLDLGLPKLDGLAVLKRWRAAGRDTPVLVLTARGAWTERVEGIDAGADDYLPKPFQMEELRRPRPRSSAASAGRGEPVQRSARSRSTATGWARALRGAAGALAARIPAARLSGAARGKVVPPTELLEHLYGDDDAREANALEALVTRLRRKLGPGVIGTRRGFGYFLEAGRDLSFVIRPCARTPHGCAG